MDILRVFTAFSGYDSQCMALDRLGIGYELVGWSEIDKYAIKAHNAVYPQYSDRNYGDISKIDWDRVPDFDLFTMSSPCFVEGTLVLTKNGYKPIEDITLSDEVLTHTNTFHKVIKPMRRRYESVVYNLSSPIFNDLTCTEEHPLYVRRMWRKGHESRRTFDEPQWLSPKQMMADLVSGCKPATRRYYIGYAINKESRLPQWDGSIDNRWGHHNEVNHLSPLFTNPSFWYIMGRYVGDGWKRDSEYGKSIIICCGGRNEGRLIEAFSEVGWHFRAVEERTVRKYIICMNELFAFVERYGYYAYGKHIDGETLNLPKDLLKGFIEGVIDSDGCFINGVYKITSVSKELVYGLGQCVAKVYNRPFSIYKTLRPEKTMIGDRLVNQRDSWNINWKIGSDKQDKAFYEDGYIWAPINKIEWANKRCEVYNMEVDSDNSYTANGAIAHNCQDFSSAGLQKGGAEGSGTRSSLLWECRKAILAKRPKYVLFENVKALVSDKFRPYFLKWQNELSSYGYSNYAKVLNAKDYGVPQNRERIFMVSILGGEGTFYFPRPFKLEKRLKDILEEHVDERYYLSDKLIECFIKRTEIAINKGNGFRFSPTGGNCVAKAITTKEGCRTGDNYIKEPAIHQVGNIAKSTAWANPQIGRVYLSDGLSPTLNTMRGGGKQPIITVIRGRSGIYGNRRLNDMIDNGAIPCNKKVYVDAYNGICRDDISGTITTRVDASNLYFISEPNVLTPKRTEYGKSIRKQYEAGEVEEKRKNIQQLESRNDGLSNAITTVQKDNLLFEPCCLGYTHWKDGKVVSRHTQEYANTIHTHTGRGGNTDCFVMEVKKQAEYLRSIANKTRNCQCDVTINEDFSLRPFQKDSRKSGISELQTDYGGSTGSTLIAARPNLVYDEITNYRIRKLTERECFRLMGVSEADIDKIQNAGISKTQQYKMAGNSIVVDVLYYIFRKLFVDKGNEERQLTLF